MLLLQNELSSKLEKDPLFKRSSYSDSLDSIRKNAQVRARRIIDYGFLSDPRVHTHPLYVSMNWFTCYKYNY